MSVSGSGIFRVNGNIGDFILSSKIDSGVTIVCTGTCYETDIQDRVITNLQKLTLNVSSNEGGTLTATGEKLYTDSGDTFAAAGSEVTLTATPTEGYHFKEWQASNGVTITDNKFSMPESDTEITAVFEEHIYEEWKSNGNDTHTGICSCGDEKTEACTFVDGVCTGCSYVDVTISAGPESSTVKEGETATFTVTANGDNIYYQWQFSTDNGSTWMDITDATSNSYTTAETTMDMDGYQYHCVVSNTTGDSATSDAATLTVNKTTSTITPAYIGYFVEHYQKDPVSGEYELAEREYFVDEINKEVTATPKTYEGYTYDPDAEGTVTNGTLTNIESEADIVTLKLYYTLNTYEVILNTNGGTIEDGYDVTSYTYGVGATLPTGEQITRKGYDFVGWYANEELSGEVVRAISDTDIGDKTYYAGWEASTYEVTLVTNGGTINSGSVTEYTYGVGATLPRAEDMTYDGHVFKGWYESEDFTGEAVTAISATDTGDKTYYARWTKLYTVTVTAGTGGTVSANKTTAAEGETVTLTAFPDSGYHFDGWRVVSGTVTIQNNHFTMPAGNVEIQAIFDRNSSGGGTPTKTPSQQAEDKIKGAKDGDTVEITLPAGRTELDKEVFETLAGREVTLEVSVPGGVTWTVNGQDIPRNAALTDIDMGVSMGTSTIPVSIINAVTGEVSTVQFTLAHDGPFGFTMTLTAPLGAENAGLWANLYYYDEDSRALEFQAASRIGADGTASFPFSHASGYAIVIDTVSHEPVELPFTDVPEDAWYADAAAYVYRHGLMNGVSSTVFAPDTTTSRAMIATILWRMAGSPVVNYAMDYTDVAQGQWCSEAIRWATSEGIVTGYGDGLFGTNDPITRQQFAAMLWRYAQAQGYDVSIGEDTNILSYTDAFDVAEYAIPAIQWAVGAGIVNGTSADTLTPQGRATRAQAAVMLMRFCQRYTDSAE